MVGSRHRIADPTRTGDHGDPVDTNECLRCRWWRAPHPAGEAAKELAVEVGGEAWVVDLTETVALESLELDVDILVSNAGIQHVSPIESFDPAIFRTMLALMVEAPFLLVRAGLCQPVNLV